MPTILAGLLNNVEQEELVVSQRLECGKAKKKFSISGLKVVAPDTAVKDDVILLSGGSILKLDLSTELSEYLSSDEQKILNQIISQQKSAISSEFSKTLPNSQGGVIDFFTYDNFLNTYKLSVNKILIEDILDDKTKSMPRFSLSFLKTDFDKLRLTDTEIKSFDEYKEFLDKARKLETSALGSFATFKFKFITIEALLELLRPVGAKVEGGKRVEGVLPKMSFINKFQFKNQNGTIIYKYYNELLDVYEKRITDDQEIDRILTNCISYLFPIHNVPKEMIEEDYNFYNNYGYYTIINNKAYFRFPNLSGNDIESINNVFKMGKNFGDTDDVRAMSYYMSFDVVFSEKTSFQYPLKYLPPPCPKLMDFDLLLESNDNKSYPLTFQKHGLIDGHDYPFGVSKSNADEYKVVLSVLTKNKINPKLSGNLHSMSNFLEMCIFPKSEIMTPLKDMLTITGDTSDDVFRKYYRELKNIANLSGAIKKYEDLRAKYGGDVSKLEDEYGIIPSALTDKFISDKSMLAVESRYDALLDLSGEKSFFDIFNTKEKNFDSNVSNFKKSSSHFQDSILLCHTPRVVYKNEIGKPFYSKTFNQLNISDSENPREDLDRDLFYCKIKESDLQNLYRIGESTSGPSNKELNFNLYIVDKYGQYTKVYEKKSGIVKIRSEVPNVKSVSSLGKPLNQLQICDQLNIQVDGSSLNDITSATLTLKGVGVGENNRTVEPITKTFSNSLQGGVFYSLQQDDRGRLNLQALDSGENIVDICDVFLLNETGYFDLLLYSETELIDSFPDLKIIENDLIEKGQVKSVKTLNPGDFMPRGSSDKKFLYDIPIVSDALNYPKIRIKSAKKVFSSIEDLNGYIAAPINYGTQTEEDVYSIFEDCEFRDKIVKIKFDDENLANSHPYFQNVEFLLLPNIVFNTSNQNLEIFSSDKASVVFPGSKYSRYNLDNLRNLKHACFLFLDKEIDNLLSQEKSSLTLSKDILNKKTTYSIIPIGNYEENSDRNGKEFLRPFISPPFIRQIAALRNSNSSGQIPKLKSNIYINNSLKYVYEEIKKKFSIGLGDFQEKLPFNPATGQTIYMSKNTKYLAVLFDGPSRKSDLDNYDVFVGDEKTSGFAIGPFSFGNAVRVYKNIIRDGISTIGIIILKNIKLNKVGIQNIKVFRKDIRYNNFYTSKLVKKYTIPASSENVFFDSASKNILSTKHIEYFEKGKINIIDSKRMPIKNRIDDDERVALLSEEISITPSIRSSYTVYSSANAEQKSADLISKTNTLASFKKDAINIIIDQNASKVELHKDFKEELEKSTQDLLKKIGSSNLDEALKSDLESDKAIIENLKENIQSTKESSETSEEKIGQIIATLTDFILKKEGGLLKVDPMSSIANDLLGLKKNAALLFSKISITNKVVAIKEGFGIPVGSLIYNNMYIKNENQYKIFLEIEWGGTSNVRFNVPHIDGIYKNGDQFFSGDELSQLPLEAGNSYSILFNDLDDQNLKLEINNVRHLDINNNVALLNIGENEAELLDFSNTNITDSCNKTISLYSGNSDWNNASRNLGDEFARAQAEAVKAGRDANDFVNKFFVQGPDTVGEVAKELFNEFCEKKAPKFIQEQICGGGYNQAIKSFCDFSLQATFELNVHLKSFKQVLVVIKVIFCIIDVLCALTNPVKLAFALVRLFQCLYDLLLLLPQLSVPVMFLKLMLHLLELLTCVIDKILFLTKAINEIFTAMKKAFEDRNLAAIKNLQASLEKYFINLEVDLAVLDPIMETLAIFIEMMQLLFRFPCNVSEGDDLGVLCLEASNLAGFIIGKVAPSGSIEHQFLLPVAQNYTTIDPDDSPCGNTPAESQDTSMATSDPFGFDNCNFGSSVIERISDNYSRIVVDKSSSEKFIDSIKYENDENKYMRMSDDFTSFDATFAVSCTETVRNRIGPISSILPGGNPRRVVFIFDNKAESYGIGNWVVFKNRVNKNQTLDAPFKLLKKTTLNRIRVSEKEEKGELVSLQDGFNDFIEDSSLISTRSNAKPLTLILKELDGTEYSLTYDTMPSFAIIDDNFNVYFIEENGIIFNENNEVEQINALMVNKLSADLIKYSEKDSQVPKGGDKGLVSKLHQNYSYLNGLGYWQMSYGNSNKTLSDIRSDFPLLSNEQIEGAPYPDLSPNFAKNYSTNDSDIEELSDSTETVKVLSFPSIYIVDLRHFTDEIIEACQVSGINDIFSSMELDDNAADDVTDIINNQNICMQQFIDCVRNSKISIQNGIANLNFNVPAFDIEKIKKCFLELVECTNGSISDICRFVFNPLNTTFKLSTDDSDEPRTDVVNPSEIDDDIVAEAAGGLDNFEFPNITGAEEYASGIGDEVTTISGTAVEFEIIPRDSYDDPMDGDLSDKISINIFSDETGSARVLKYENNVVFKQGDSYYGSIISQGVGTVKITARVCSKTIKAFTYKGLTDEAGVVAGVVSCVEPNNTGGEDLNPVGTLIRVDRVLIINYKDRSDQNIGIISNTEESLDNSITTPQQEGTKLEN